MTALEACPTPSDRADEGPVAPPPGDADRTGRATAALVLRWTAVPAGVLDDDVGAFAVLRCTVAPGVPGEAVEAPGVLRRTVAPPPALDAADGGAVVPDVAVPASSPTGDCLTVLPGAATGRPDGSEPARRCTFVPDDAASGSDAEVPGCGASRLDPEDCDVSGVAEAIGLVPVVAAPALVDDEGAVLEGLVASAAPAEAGPAVEGAAPGAAERVDGGVVAGAGVADARCTVVPDPDPGDAVVEVGVVEGDDGAVRRLSVVLPVPAAGVPGREIAGGVRADDVVAAGLAAVGFVAAGLVAVGSVGAGVVAAGVVAVRGGAAEVRGRRCTAAVPPDVDAADVLVVDVVDPPEEVDAPDLVDPLDAPDALVVLPVVELPDVVGPPDVVGGVDELAGRDVAEFLPGVAAPVGEVGGCCGE